MDVDNDAKGEEWNDLDSPDEEFVQPHLEIEDCSNLDIPTEEGPI